MLDVNVLLALVDQGHLHNRAAHRWIEESGRPFRWATCPLIENAFVRILAHSSYPNSVGNATAARRLLIENCASENHVFWPDDVSIRDDVFVEDSFFASKDVADLYLLALAIKHGGKLATFDRKIPAEKLQGGVSALKLIASTR